MCLAIEVETLSLERPGGDAASVDVGTHLHKCECIKQKQITALGYLPSTEHVYIRTSLHNVITIFILFDLNYYNTTIVSIILIRVKLYLCFYG